MNLEKVAMTALVEKLTALGGIGSFKSREWRIRVRLSWHTKSKSAVRHILSGARKISLEEGREIEAAHIKWCASQVKAHRDADAKLFAEMQSAIEAMQRSDPEFYRPHIEAVRDILFPAGNMGNDKSGEV